MKSWFSKRSECPTGCGCLCEQSSGSTDSNFAFRSPGLQSEDLSDGDDDRGHEYDDLDLYRKYFPNKYHQSDIL